MKTTPGRAYRDRLASGKSRNKRIIALIATLVAFGGIVAVTQVSNAATDRRRGQAAPSCPPGTSAPADADPSAAADQGAAATPTVPAGADPSAPGSPDPANPNAPYRDNGAIQHPGDGQVPAPRRRGNGRNNDNNCTPNGTSSSAPANPGSGNNNGLEILGDSCSSSRLEPHSGFQDGNRCVDTAFGEVGAAENNPTLIITRAPRVVRRNQPFTITVSTRNLVRDRFLGAAAGGYYLESSFLTEDGLTRGHFHTACRMLNSRNRAPDPEPVPAFFVATEDGKGGRQPDQVTITIPGLPERGIAQCASWAGDGSHRVPMMQRANQIPAFDVVRIEVR